MLERFFRRKTGPTLSLEEAQRELAKLKAERIAKDPAYRAETEAYERQRQEQEVNQAYRKASTENAVWDFNKDSIVELKEPIKNIIQELSSELEAGVYSVIIGDDASGRIPTIMVGTIAKRIAERNGAQAPIVRFLAGTTGLYKEQEELRNEKERLLKEQIDKIKQTTLNSGRKLGKVLVVTDTIESGESMNNLLDAIRSNEWDADVAVVGISEMVSDTNKVTRMVPTNVVLGMHKVPDIYNLKTLTGIQKDKTKLFAIRHPESSDEEVRRGRRQAKEIAEEVFKEYENKPEK